MLGDSGRGSSSVAQRWYLTIHVRNAGMHVKLPDRGCIVRMRMRVRIMYVYAYAYIHTYMLPTMPCRQKIALQYTACSECRPGQCWTAERCCCLSHIETCKCGGTLRL